MWILLATLAYAATPSGTVEPPSTAAHDQSAARLRSMLDHRSAGPALARAEVVDAIDERHPKVRAAWLAVDEAQGKAQAALGAFDPVLSAGGKSLVGGYYGYVVGDATIEWDAGPITAWAGWRLGVDSGRGGLPDYYGEYETLAGGEARLGASLDLLQGLARNPQSTRLRVATLGVDAAAARQDATQVLLRRDAALAWIKWVAAGRKLALEQSLLDIARAREGAVAVRVELGVLAAIETVRNRQILAQRMAAAAEARGALIAATENLSLYLRDDDGRPVRVGAERLPERALPTNTGVGWAVDPVGVARASHPALEALRQDQAARRAEGRLARNGLLPDLSLEVEHGRDVVAGSAPDESLRRPTTAVGVKAKVPLLNWKDRGKAVVAEAKADKATAELLWAEDRVVADVRVALAREEAALAGWRAATETVELAIELQDGEQQRFAAGEIDLLRLWQVEQSTAKAISTEIEEWMRYELAKADLEAAVGVPLPERTAAEPAR